MNNTRDTDTRDPVRVALVALSLALRRGGCTSADVMREAGVTRRTATTALDRLAQCGEETEAIGLGRVYKYPGAGRTSAAHYQCEMYGVHNDDRR